MADVADRHKNAVHPNEGRCRSHCTRYGACGHDHQCPPSAANLEYGERDQQV
eukprot:CAMPEP_0177418378 /NCGR_PEP_ID=MMETSP0368-20130122/69149_1 /TAXON_ID=447022 ORGANISM="Scrippsiella hangoei-like, Strain SHHI-4" /NCGR_SAMPLE_ID=MMETSP0368 /ASSEMBLY_ACC=CAM_ASM_000363 /LENGTH=51 /DNA_ID=CAMNT_0018888017 /DNA_START=133 /DNA_END=288 /DNA_ORIENTATION=+